MLIQLVVILTAGLSCQAFIAYDCDHPDNEVRSLNLLEVEPCPHVMSDYHPPRSVQTQVVRVDTDLEIRAYRYCDFLIRYLFHVIDLTYCKTYVHSAMMIPNVKELLW